MTATVYDVGRRCMVTMGCHDRTGSVD